MTEQNEGNDLKKEYSEEHFWDKVKKYARTAGSEVIEKVLILYYTMQDSATPMWAKGIITGALAYFIMPIDAISDLLPGVGYTDDLGVIAAAFATVLAEIKPKHIEAAKEKMKQWFGKE
jgi:uncharacterized membrane protein YkvA (DUF1232 family)